MWFIGLAQRGNYKATKTCRLQYVFQSSITFGSLSRLTPVRKRQNDENLVPKALILILSNYVKYERMAGVKL